MLSLSHSVFLGVSVSRGLRAETNNSHRIELLVISTAIVPSAKMLPSNSSKSLFPNFEFCCCEIVALLAEGSYLP